jgi:hypothetical protein
MIPSKRRLAADRPKPGLNGNPVVEIGREDELMRLVIRIVLFAIATATAFPMAARAQSYTSDM